MTIFFHQRQPDIQIVDSGTSTTQVINDKVNERNTEIAHLEVISEKAYVISLIYRNVHGCQIYVAIEST